MLNFKEMIGQTEKGNSVRHKDFPFISPGNLKLGHYTPSISLAPDRFCEASPCFAKCYAVRLMKLRPNVRRTWQKNSDLYQAEPNFYFEKICQYLRLYQPRYFRWHVGGEIPSRHYLDGVINAAAENRSCRFLIYTKRYDLLCSNAGIPSNLLIRMSVWEQMDYRGSRFPKAFVVSKNDLETFAGKTPDAIMCPGHCPACGWQCWNFSGNIVFPLR